MRRETQRLSSYYASWTLRQFRSLKRLRSFSYSFIRSRRRIFHLYIKTRDCLATFYRSRRSIATYKLIVRQLFSPPSLSLQYLSFPYVSFFTRIRWHNFLKKTLFVRRVFFVSRNDSWTIVRSNQIQDNYVHSEILGYIQHKCYV